MMAPMPPASKPARARPLNIVYVVPSSLDKPAGGVKVLYQQCERVAAAFGPAVTAQLLHLPDPRRRYDWFDSRAPQRHHTTLDPAHDLVVLPEVIAPRWAPRLQQSGVRYAIYVQGGYLITQHTDKALLTRIYADAARLLSISDDTTECIELAYPGSRPRIVRQRWSIDAGLFTPLPDKARWITYMPRKLPNHSATAAGFLHNRLPPGWKLVPIDNMSQAEVAHTLARSRIFMAFCELEGLALPPMEAALAGNVVVGYTGEGAREYWAPPLFHEIPMGKVRALCETVLALAHEDPAPAPGSPDAPWVDRHAQARAQLAAQWSAQAELSSLAEWVAQAREVMASAPTPGLGPVRLGAASLSAPAPPRSLPSR